MTVRTSEEAQKRVCWVGLEIGEAFCCFGNECTAWLEVEFDRLEDGNDITPKGECALLLARLRGE